MKNINKLNLIFLAVFVIFSSNAIAGERILPLSKPTVDLETKKITEKKKSIYPKKKQKK